MLRTACLLALLVVDFALGRAVGPEPPPCKKVDPTTSSATQSYLTWTDREYVWGPGDVDELILQIDQAGTLQYALTDGQLNVVGLLDADGVLIRQDAYSPYGEVIATDYFNMAPGDNHVGYKGLFFDRFSTLASDGTLAPGAAGVYQSRNRSYNPQLGRFLQRDPNATAQPIIQEATYEGHAMALTLGAFDIDTLFGDGMNLYVCQARTAVLLWNMGSVPSRPAWCLLGRSPTRWS